MKNHTFYYNYYNSLVEFCQCFGDLIITWNLQSVNAESNLTPIPLHVILTTAGTLTKAGELRQVLASSVIVRPWT
jgi:hypothetical protein